MMDKFNKFLDNYGIRAGILLVIVLIISSLIITFIGKAILSERNEFITDRAKIDLAIETVGKNVNLMDMGLRGFYMSSSEAFLDPYNAALISYEANFDSLTFYLVKYDFQHLDSIEYMRGEITSYAQLVSQGVEDIRAGNKELAAAVFKEDPGHDLWLSYGPVLASISGFVNQKAQESENSYQRISNISFISLLLLLILGIPVLIVVLLRMRRSDHRIRRLFNEVASSNKKYILDNGEKVELGSVNGAQIISSLVENLKNASSFIKSITKADLDATFNGINDSNIELNRETISGELIAMRDQMASVKEEERKRFWITEGLSKFAELVRLNQDSLEQLSQALISEIVNYTKCNQGGLFLLKQEEESKQDVLELASCYAYERQKFLQKIIKPGEGVLGQAFLEQETIILKEIPDDYINITSGLGQALPKNLLVVPLKSNDKVEGVLEVAAFREFEDYEVEFLEKFGEIVASAIINAKTVSVTNELLESAQQNQEEMRAQEEEMRQNMEELQATQEEMERKEKEYVQIIEDLKSQVGKQES